MPTVKPYFKTYRAFPDVNYFYVENTYAGDNVFTLKKEGYTTLTTASDLQYSLDKENWTTLDVTITNTITLHQGDKIYLRSTTGLSTSDTAYLHLTMSQSAIVGGHVASLIDYTHIDTIDTIPSYNFCHLLQMQSTITSVANLDFSGITTVEREGIEQMFDRLTALTDYPNFDDITTIGFKGCRSLFTETSLKSAPRFPKLTSADGLCFEQAFKGCTNLISGADIRSYTVRNSTNICRNMYKGCTKINLVYTPNITYNYSGALDNWLSNASSSGVVMKYSSVVIGPLIAENSVSGIPTGWTTENY